MLSQQQCLHPDLLCLQAQLYGAVNTQGHSQPELCQEVDALASLHAAVRHGQAMLAKTTQRDVAKVCSAVLCIAECASMLCGLLSMQACC